MQYQLSKGISKTTSHCVQTAFASRNVWSCRSTHLATHFFVRLRDCKGTCIEMPNMLWVLLWLSMIYRSGTLPARNWQDTTWEESPKYQRLSSPFLLLLHLKLANPGWQLNSQVPKLMQLGSVLGTQFNVTQLLHCEVWNQITSNQIFLEPLANLGLVQAHTILIIQLIPSICWGGKLRDYLATGSILPLDSIFPYKFKELFSTSWNAEQLFLRKARHSCPWRKRVFELSNLWEGFGSSFSALSRTAWPSLWKNVQVQLRFMLEISSHMGTSYRGVICTEVCDCIGMRKPCMPWSCHDHAMHN